MNPKTRNLLEKILLFAKKTHERMKCVSLDTFLSDEFLQDAVLYCLGQIGETASNIPDDEQEKYPAVFWNQMISLRHRIFHDYEALNFSIIYEITQKPIENLIQIINDILR